MDYILKPVKNTPEQDYVDYLLCRLMEFRRAGSRLGQKFSIPLTLQFTRQTAEKQLGCKLNDPARFDEICAHLQSKIEKTILGQRNTAKGWRCWHSFDEDRTQEHRLHQPRIAAARPLPPENILPPSVVLPPVTRHPSPVTSLSPRQLATAQERLRTLRAAWEKWMEFSAASQGEIAQLIG
ncbi:MAG TPA: hypothetical protein VIK53_12040, partial [Verrucomicrobiae bacterium]